MPKELIQRPSVNGISTELTVNWSKEENGGYVQLGLTRHICTRIGPSSYQQEPALTVAGMLSPGDHTSCDPCHQAKKRIEQLKVEQLKAEVRKPMGRGDSTDAPAVSDFDDPATVFTEVLTREQINNMIRALRRARDQAYGPDA